MAVAVEQMQRLGQRRHSARTDPICHHFLGIASEGFDNNQWTYEQASRVSRLEAPTACVVEGFASARVSPISPLHQIVLRRTHT
jgi:hypothetical protein